MKNPVLIETLVVAVFLSAAAVAVFGIETFPQYMLPYIMQVNLIYQGF